MKSTLRSFAACAALLAAALSFLAGSAHASTVVQGLTIQFTSLEEGKDPGSSVSVTIQTGDGKVVASSEVGKAALPAKAVSPEFPVAYKNGPLTTDSLSGFKVNVQMQGTPGKTDTWKFTYVIKLHLANGSVIARQAAPCLLKSSSGGSVMVARDFHL